MTLVTVPTAELVPVETNRADRHPAAVYIARLGPGSRRTMRGALDVAADIVMPGADAWSFPWHQLRYQHTQALRSVLAERYSPAQANKVLSAVRGALREAWRLGQLDAETFHRAIDVPRVQGTRLPAGRALSAAEVRALFSAAAADPTPAGARDAAMLAVAFGCGLRRAELAALELSDYTPETGALVIRQGKGNRARVAYAPAGARAAIDDWLAVRGDWAGPLLCRVRKGGAMVQAGISASAIYLRVETLAARARIARFTPHDARRTMISDLLDNGADLSAAQALAGHASPTTTARYDRRPEEAKRKAAELLLVPYVR